MTPFENADSLLHKFANDIPAKISQYYKFYSTDDKITFCIWSPTGGIFATKICYLISPGDNYTDDYNYIDNYIFGFEFHSKVTTKQLESSFYRAVCSFLYKLGTNTARIYDPNGGDLGRGDLKSPYDQK